MPQDWLSYLPWPDFEKAKEYLADAVSLFDDANLKQYDVVLVVAVPDNTGFISSPAYIAWTPEDRISVPGGEIGHFVQFGDDSYRADERTLIHEIGHIVGLPDHYDIDDWDPSIPMKPDKVGWVSLTDDRTNAQNFLGWDQYMMYWLLTSQVVYLEQYTHPTGQEFVLNPLSFKVGTVLLVLPLEVDPSIENPSKVCVIEVSTPVTNGPSVSNQGILAYTVDASIGTGFQPIEVIPREPSILNSVSELNKAVYRVGDTAIVEENGARVEVEVLNEIGIDQFSSFHVNLKFSD